MTALAYYLLKVIVCSGILVPYYHLALRNKIYHQWNRFYLLATVFLSLTVPLLQFTFLHNEETAGKAIQLLQVVQSADNYMEEIYIRNHEAVDTEQWIAFGYTLVSVVLFVGLLSSVLKICAILRRHNVQQLRQIKFVATEEKGTPFSFFRYVFWNNKIDINSPAGQQIFQHELVHVKEAHTIDKLFLQLVLVVFWCNPFFWLIRKELQLIHEFIADKKAVQQHDTAALAAMILQSVYPHQFSTITNQFFQSSIKRRLLMLTKIQNPRVSYASRLLALPLIAFTVFAFGFKAKNSASYMIPLDKEITVVIDAGHGNTNGRPSGAHADGIFEDDIVLALAKKVQEVNNNNKINIVLTRTSPDIVDLRNRVDIAREKKADLFISLHLAAAENDAATNGIEVLVSHKNTAYQQESQLLASALTEELAGVYTTSVDLGKRKTGVFVLDQNICPSVLIECGYITNKKDRDFITAEANQKLLAEKIITAIQRYAAAAAKDGIGMQNPANTSPKNTDKQIVAIDVNKNAGTITLSYGDGTSEILSNDQARQRKLLKSNEATISENKSSTQTQDKEAVSLAGDKKPLYFVDGKEFHGDLDKLNPNKIESINVLKGKAAQAKYGNKGKNGAVEILTKPGSSKAIFDTLPNKQPVFEKAEVAASVDMQEWKSFLEKNLQPVLDDLSKRTPSGQYTIPLRFLVDLDGSVSDVKALDNMWLMGDRLVEIMEKSPRWRPAFQNGKPVKSYHTQPVTLVITNGKKPVERSTSADWPVTDANELKSRSIHDLIQVNSDYEIVSFTMRIDMNNGTKTVDHSGNEFTTEDQAFLAQYVKPGHLMTIDAIKVKLNGEQKKIPGKIYKL